jgi:isopentenyldiphosphate isomerase
MKYLKINKKYKQDNFCKPIEYFSADGKYLGQKRRRLVHTEGKFHLGAQVFIVKNINNKLYILSQIRNIVDIASIKIDHSAAVQLLPEDKRNPVLAMKRALKQELGIGLKDIQEIKCISNHIDMRVAKQYSDEPKSLYNREFVYTVLAKINDDAKIVLNTDKVKSVSWVEYKSFVSYVLKNPRKCAKNLRNNFVNQHLSDLIYFEGCKMIGIDIINKPKKLINSSYYSPANNKDIILSKFSDNTMTIQKLMPNGKIIEKPIESINLEYFKRPNLLKRFV